MFNWLKKVRAEIQMRKIAEAIGTPFLASTLMKIRPDAFAGLSPTDDPVIKGIMEQWEHLMGSLSDEGREIVLMTLNRQLEAMAVAKMATLASMIASQQKRDDDDPYGLFDENGDFSNN